MSARAKGSFRASWLSVVSVAAALGCSALGENTPSGAECTVAARACSAVPLPAAPNPRAVDAGDDGSPAHVQPDAEVPVLAPLPAGDAGDGGVEANDVEFGQSGMAPGRPTSQPVPPRSPVDS
jgi:hypothetical protein